MLAQVQRDLTAEKVRYIVANDGKLQCMPMQAAATLRGLSDVHYKDQQRTQ